MDMMVFMGTKCKSAEAGILDTSLVPASCLAVSVSSCGPIQIQQVGFLGLLYALHGHGEQGVLLGELEGVVSERDDVASDAAVTENSSLKKKYS